MKNSLTITPIQTRIYRQGESLLDFIFSEIPDHYWQENNILVISSKIISLAENRIIKKSSVSKKDLIQQEGQHYLGEFSEHNMSLTIHHNLLMPAAGIDESNSESGDYILLPSNPFISAHNLLTKIKLQKNLNNFGLLLTDSKSNPLRHGTVGISLAYAGFTALENKIGEKDLFGRTLKITKINIVDSLSGAAVLMMGESDESSPLAIISGAKVHFKDNSSAEELYVPIDQDLYRDLYFDKIKK